MGSHKYAATPLTKRNTPITTTMRHAACLPPPEFRRAKDKKDAEQRQRQARECYIRHQLTAHPQGDVTPSYGSNEETDVHDIVKNTHYAEQSTDPKGNVLHHAVPMVHTSLPRASEFPSLLIARVTKRHASTSATMTGPRIWGFRRSRTLNPG